MPVVLVALSLLLDEGSATLVRATVVCLVVIEHLAPPSSRYAPILSEGCIAVTKETPQPFYGSRGRSRFGLAEQRRLVDGLCEFVAVDVLRFVFHDTLALPCSVHDSAVATDGVEV